MEKKLDLRGLSCPIPLLETQKALEEAATVIITVDDPSARESITKFANSRKYQVESSSSTGEFTLVIRK